MTVIVYPVPGLSGALTDITTITTALPGISGALSGVGSPPGPPGGGTWYPRPFDQTLFRPLDFEIPKARSAIWSTQVPPPGPLVVWVPRGFDQTLFRPRDFEIPKAHSAIWSTQVPPPVKWVPRGFDPYLHQARFPRIDVDRPRILIGAAIRPRTQIAGNILSMRQTSPNAVTIYMPPSAAIGKPYIITDTLGVCGSYTFTIATSGGSTITTMTTDGASRGLYWDGFGWVVFLKS